MGFRQMGNVCGLIISNGKPKHTEESRPQHNNLNDNATLPIAGLNPGVCWDISRLQSLPHKAAEIQ
jgi:hypothetical protein